jgi:oxygen-independent coproporphyrinogen III oxidase
MDISLYFHIPFCVHRCAYCDFNTYAGQEALIPDYVSALAWEVELVAGNAPEKMEARTIFFGGGTPSSLSPTQFETILQQVAHHFKTNDAEITIEANPGTVSLSALREMRALGINRLSFGVQSVHPAELRQLERIHDHYDVIQSVKWARQAGFDNLNLDLIFGLPEQSLGSWQATLKQVLGLNPEHLSLYGLTLEHGTPFGRWHAHGLLPVPDPDLAAEMYEWAGEFLAAKGYEQYEISNWSRPGHACLHNLGTWRDQYYLGFGAGAHGYAAGVRYSNILRIKSYLERLNGDGLPGSFPLSPAAINVQKITRRVEMHETMLLGFRLVREGVSTATFLARFGMDMETVFEKEISTLLRLGLLEWSSPASPDGRTLRLTHHGRLLANQVFLRFVGD